MKQLIPAFFIVGAVMVLFGAALTITHWTLQINSPSRSNSPVVKRLRRQQIFGALLLVLTGAFMFFTHGNEWIVSLTIAAVLELYTSFRIPQEEAKDER